MGFCNLDCFRTSIYYARTHFASGDLPLRREVFSKLGSNFILKDKKLALQLDDDYLAFTPEFRQQTQPFEPDKERLNKLQSAGLAPADPRWLPSMDSNHDKRSQNPLSYR